MNSGSGSCKISIVISLAILLISCSSQGVSIVKGEYWLDSKAKKAEMNVSGAWSSPEWGEALFEQEGNRVTGTLGDYPVRGIVSGSSLYLMMCSGEKVDYFAELKAVDNNLFVGLYSKYRIIDEVRDEPSLTKSMKLTKK